MAGATAVQVGTANFTDPYAMPKIIKGLDEWCDGHGVANVSELTGVLTLNQR
jgi:dihydroorotate dehydrogenase (NAD+) catalytic subunit